MRRIALVLLLLSCICGSTLQDYGYGPLHPSNELSFQAASESNVPLFLRRASSDNDFHIVSHLVLAAVTPTYLPLKWRKSSQPILPPENFKAEDIPLFLLQQKLII